MKMNCEQTRTNLVLHHQDSTLTNRSLQHLRMCPACQMDYEALWHTATVLENVEEPVPPPELVAKIQASVRSLHKRRHIAFFANPLAWCLDRLKLELSPKFVNSMALLFYLIASGFIVKLAFFTSPPARELGLTAMEEARLRNVRVSPASWALIKGKTADPADTIPAKPYRDDNISHADNMWNLRSTNTEKLTWHQGHSLQFLHIENVPSLSTIDVSQKLTVFWNHIKTEL